MPQGVEEYLYDRAVAMLRSSWGGGQLEVFAQEMAVTFWGIPRPIKKVTTTDSNGDPYTVPPITFPTIDPNGFDFDLPDSPAIDPPVVIPPVTPNVDPNDPQDPNVAPPDGQPTTSTRTIVQRNTFPGKILDKSGNDFLVALYLNGLQDLSKNRTVNAQCTDEEAANEIEVGTWVMVYMVVHYAQTVTQIENFDTTGDLQAENTEYIFIPPGAGGGAGLAITTSDIDPRDDPDNPRSDPGDGTAILRVLVEGVWVDGESVTLYNSTSTPVDSDKCVQWHTIFGLRFVDVEDCGQ